MIAIMMSTFILLFAFVINTGMLVNAKINLQNAADLAAYAGAAVQARQLTQIGYLNYEMRRQYKKFLYRIYVIGNMAEKSFPTSNPDGASAKPAVYSPDGNGSYGAPTTCVIFNSNDNYCQLTAIPPIQIPPPNVLDAITSTLSGQLQAIENIRQNNCRATGTTNLMLNMLWLYNANPNLNLSAMAGMDQVQQNTAGILQNLGSGIGLVPREMLLRWRIKTLNGYVNAIPQMNLTKETVDGFSKQFDTAGYERTIQAFYSAYYTLGNHTFAGNTITMDELMPSSSTNANLLLLHDIKDQFDTYAIDFDLGNGVGAPANSATLNSSANPTGTTCTPKSVPLTLPQPLIFGVYKDPTVLTYYAIRLTATAQVLFSPFGNIQMKAYAAAQPFGSRIGPTSQDVSFTTAPGSQATNVTNSMNLVQKLPNLAVRAQDSTGRGSGWDTVEVQGQMYQALGLSGNGTNAISFTMLQEAYQAAMAPTPWEGNRYTIINDQGGDPFMKNFDTNNLAAFWAPIYPPGTNFTSSDNLVSAIQEFFSGDVSSTQGNFGQNGSASLSSILTTIKSNLQTYLGSTLSQGQGENMEGTNIVRITNPFMQLNSTPILGNALTTVSPTAIKTAWNNVNRSDFKQLGRTGYSVKFISFDSLTNNKLTTNGETTWSNSINMDAEGQQDIPFIKH